LTTPTGVVGGPKGYLRQRPILSALVYAIVGSFPLFLAGAYAVRLQDDLMMSKSQFGWAASAYFITATIGSLQLGRFVDRRGSHIGFVTAAVGSAISCVIIGLVTSTWWMLAIALGITGFSNTAGQLAGNRILAGDVREGRQGFGFGAKQASVPLGSFVAGLFVSSIGVNVAWETTYIVFAFIAVGLAVIAPGFGPPDIIPDRGKQSVGDDRPYLTGLAIAGALAGATGNGLAVLVVDAFDSAGFDESVAAAALAFGSFMAVVGRIGIGWLVDRRGGDGFLELAVAIGVGTIGFAILAAAGSNGVAMFVGVFLGFAAGWGWPAIIYFVVVRSATSASAGAGTGFVLTGVFFGAIIGAPLFATIAENFSYTSSWVVATVMAGVATVGVWLSSRLVPPRA
jgi:MFS family permease